MWDYISMLGNLCFGNEDGQVMPWLWPPGLSDQTSYGMMNQIRETTLGPWKKNYGQPSILKSRDITLLTKVHLVKAMVFSVVMYGCELDYKESWAQKNWCFWTVVLEKTLESPVDCKEFKPVNSKGNQSWVFIGRTDAEAGVPILWLPYGKSWLINKDRDGGNDWRQVEKGLTEDQMIGWHHWPNGQEMVKDKEGWRAAVHGVTKSWTQLSNWTEQ